jgi:hypothetical protein
MREPIELATGLDAAEIDRRLQIAVRTEQISRREQAHYLAELDATLQFQKLGFSSVRQYAIERLGKTHSQVRDLLFAGKALRTLKRIDRAFAEGEIDWSRARLLSRICVPETQEAWLEQARNKNMRELEKEVACSQRGNAPGEGTSLPQLRYRLDIHLDPATQELWERAMNLVEDRDGGIAVAREVLHEVLESFLSSRGAKRPQAPAERPVEPIEEDLAEQDPTEPTGEALRQAIKERDGHRCCHCGSEVDVQVHHARPRSAGGLTQWDNLLCTCRTCHMLLHRKLLIISGSLAEGWIFLDRKGADTKLAAGEIPNPNPDLLRITFTPPVESRDCESPRRPGFIELE